MGLVNRLSEFIVGTSFDRLPTKVIEAAKERVLDTIGTMLWGQHRGNPKPLIDLATQLGGNPEASVFGRDVKLPCFWASFLNSYYAIPLADTCRYSGTHPGTVVIPAALALAEREKSRGQELITAVVLGYEIAVRIGRVVYPANSNRGFHPTSTVGQFGSVAAAGKIIGLTEEQTSHALALAGVMGAGLMEAYKALESAQVQIARACQAGLFAALLAEKGIRGSSTILEGGFLEGKGGFLAAFADKYRPESLTEGLGEEYMINGVAPKIHDGCRHIHAPIDAVMELMHRNNLKVENIQEINVKTYSEALSLEVEEPRSGIEAMFNMKFGIATALLAGDALSDKFTTKRLNDENTRQLMAKVKVELDPEIDKAFPLQLGTLVEILTGDGNKYCLKLDFPRGEPETPLSKPELDSKFRYLARPVLSSQAIERVITLINKLEAMEKVSDLVSLLQPKKSS